MVETQLAGGDFLSDRCLLAGEATQRLRGGHALASHTTLWRFCAGADLGRVAKAGAVNRAMLRRAWAMGAGPAPGRLTIDPDATWISTYGPGKEGSAFSYKHEVGMSPMLGVCGETGDVLALRARGGNANPGRAMGSFIDECVSAIPAGRRDDYQLWVRVDSAGYRADVVEAAERHGAVFTITTRRYKNVAGAIAALAADPATVWAPAIGAEEAKASEVAETPLRFAGRDLRMIVRRQPTGAGDQLSFDDLDGWRSTPSSPTSPPTRARPPRWSTTTGCGEARRRMPSASSRTTSVSATHRSRTSSATGCGGTPRPWPTTWPVGSGRWRCPRRSALAGASGCDLSFFNVAARVVRTGRRLVLRLPRAYPHAAAFIEALARLRRLPVFA